MTRLCEISGKSVQTGNNVSHSNRKTRRRFLPNLHNFSLRSDILDCIVRLRLAANGMRTIEHNLGLDNYLLSTPASRLSPEARKLKKLINKKLKVHA
jgi:large subunit ribosomal protein L28